MDEAQIPVSPEIIIKRAIYQLDGMRTSGIWDLSKLRRILEGHQE